MSGKLKVTPSRPGYTLYAESGAASFNPADATTYFFGSLGVAGVASSGGSRRLYVPKAGTIRSCYLYFFNGATGSAETSTMSIRVDNTSDTTVSDAVTNDAQPTVFGNASLATRVAEGSYIEMKWVTPTWVSNPTGVRLSAVIYIER